MIPRKFILVLAVAWGLSFQVSILLAQQDGKGLTKATVKESTDAYQELTRLAEPLISSSRVLAKLAEVVGPTVVHIESKKFSPSRKRWVEESGSGVITNLGPSLGIKVVTNRHVIQSARLQDITIRMADERILGATRVWDDPATDIAILQVDEEPLSAARLGDSDEVRVGHFVAALGSPFNHRGSLTLGIISAKHRRNLPLRGQSSTRLLNQDFLQTDAAINPGNSGGPLVNMRGEVIGINTAIASNNGGNQGVAFSIPINLVQRVANDLLTEGVVKRAFIGVNLEQNFNDKMASDRGLSRPRGALITGVFDSTPAHKAGIREGDVILKLDAIEVQDYAHLINVISLTPVGNTMKVIVWRDQKELEMALIVGDRSDFSRDLVLKEQGKQDKFAPFLELETEKTRIEKMGIEVHELSSETVRSLGFSGDKGGLLVLNILDDSPAAGKIRVFDLIDRLERKSISSLEKFMEVIETLESEEGFLVRIQRQRDGDIDKQVVLLTPR